MEIDGLNPDIINCSIFDQIARATMVILEMEETTTLKYTNEDLLVKSRVRYKLKQSCIMGYIYTTTVLSMHFNWWPILHNLTGKCKLEILNPLVKETIEWAKKAFGMEEVDLLDFNLLLLTDDATLFVLEGTDKDKNDWGWKLINKTNDSASVWSDLCVGTDVKSTGGLYVCPTFTFTVSILDAPPYVKLRGLT